MRFEGHGAIERPQRTPLANDLTALDAVRVWHDRAHLVGDVRPGAHLPGDLSDQLRFVSGVFPPLGCHRRDRPERGRATLQERCHRKPHAGLGLCLVEDFILFTLDPPSGLRESKVINVDSEQL
jgi:hypothetical protein